MVGDSDFNRLRKALARVRPAYARLASEVERSVRADRQVRSFLHSKGWRKLEPAHLPKVLRALPSALDSGLVRDELRSLRRAAVAQRTYGEALGLRGPARDGPLGSAIYTQGNQAAKLLSECGAEVARAPKLRRDESKGLRREVSQELHSRVVRCTVSGASRKEAYARVGKRYGWGSGEALRQWLMDAGISVRKSG